MITVITIFFTCFCISYYRISKKCKNKDVAFNPFYGNTIEAVIFILGFMVLVFATASLILVIFTLMIEYLP